MNISIDNQTAEYLLNKLKNDKWWMAEKIKDQIKSGFKKQEEVKNCKHRIGEFIGFKTCCEKCGTFKKGMGFSWINKKIYKQGMK
jgi:hypothetical protein